MIIQACINGARSAEYHPRLPLTPAAMAAAARGCVLAGAAEIHLHIRDRQGKESLAAADVDATVQEIRRACPGTLLGISTGEWIENDMERTLSCIRQWRVGPDYASVNLGESGALPVMRQLRAAGVGIEAGLGSLADAEKLLASGYLPQVLRILIEIEQQDAVQAMAQAHGIMGLLAGQRVRRPRLLHGFDATVWPLAALALGQGISTRVGLEDSRYLPDGQLAADNAALVAAAMAIKHPG